MTKIGPAARNHEHQRRQEKTKDESEIKRYRTTRHAKQILTQTEKHQL